MQIAHQVLLRGGVPCRVRLQPARGVRVTRSHQQLLHRESLRVRCNRRREGEALHRGGRLGLLPLSSQLQLAYPVGEVGAVIRQ